MATVFAATETKIADCRYKTAEYEYHTQKLKQLLLYEHRLRGHQKTYDNSENAAPVDA